MMECLHYFRHSQVAMKMRQKGNIEQNIAKRCDQIVVKIVVTTEILTIVTTSLS